MIFLFFGLHRPVLNLTEFCSFGSRLAPPPNQRLIKPPPPFFSPIYKGASGVLWVTQQSFLGVFGAPPGPPQTTSYA